MIIAHSTLDLYGKMVFEKATIKAPFTVPNPMPNEACFLHVVKGHGIAYSETHQTKIRPKVGVLMKCGSFINQMFSDDEDGIYEAVAVHFYPEVLKKVYENELPAFLRSPGHQVPENPAVAIEEDELFQKFFDGLLYYFSNPPLVTEELITLKLKELLLLLENTSDAGKLRTILATLFSPRIYDFKEVINTHLYADLTLSEMAGLAGMSLSTFKRSFKEVYSESPARYIRDRKLEKGVELLTSTNDSVSEIAFRSGFNDPAVFSKCFKQKFLVSPSQYRRK